MGLKPAWAGVTSLYSFTNIVVQFKMGWAEDPVYDSSDQDNIALYMCFPAHSSFFFLLQFMSDLMFVDL